MKIKNVSGTYAYCFRQAGKMVGILPGAVVEVPKESEASVARLCEQYAKNPETAVFVKMPDDAKVSPNVLPEESADEKAARERLEEKQAGQAAKQKKAADLAAQKAQEEARTANEAKSAGAPPNVIKGADGKPISLVDPSSR